jgi:signal transduction histidine kinase
LSVAVRPPHLVAGAAGLGAALTLVAAFSLPFADRRPSLHVAIETGAGLVALLAAYLLLGRFARAGRVMDVALGSALAMFGTANLAFAAVPTIVSPDSLGTSATWGALASRSLAAGIFAAAPFLPDRVDARPPRTLAAALVAVAAILAAIGVVVWATPSPLPVGDEPAGLAGDAGTPSDVGYPALRVVELAAMVLFAVAAAGFARRAARTADDLTRWLAPASALAAFAALNYFLFPSLYSAWVSLGDVLRVGFYLLVLVAIAREIGAYQREHAALAVLEERRRIARELHDGLAQELAFIAVQSRALADGTPGEPLRRIASAAGRALDEARLAISALTRPGLEPLEFALADAAEEVAYRAGAAVELDLAPGIDVLPDQRDALVRITREAIANAVRHGHAEKVEVRLTNGDGIHLAIVDGGLGFDVTETERKAPGFGLTSMKERAHAIGGELSVSSAPGDGTRVAVRLP